MMQSYAQHGVVLCIHEFTAHAENDSNRVTISLARNLHYHHPRLVFRRRKYNRIGQNMSMQKNKQLLWEKACSVKHTLSTMKRTGQ
jgi:hypothetical protein